MPNKFQSTAFAFVQRTHLSLRKFCHMLQPPLAPKWRQPPRPTFTKATESLRLAPVGVCAARHRESAQLWPWVNGWGTCWWGQVQCQACGKISEVTYGDMGALHKSKGCGLNLLCTRCLLGCPTSSLYRLCFCATHPSVTSEIL